jgi:hypothetical protein
MNRFVLVKSGKMQQNSPAGYRVLHGEIESSEQTYRLATIILLPCKVSAGELTDIYHPAFQC